MVPFKLAQLFSLSLSLSPSIYLFIYLSPLKQVWMPEEQIRSLQRQNPPFHIRFVLSVNWLPGEGSISGSYSSTQKARELKKWQGRGGRHVISETNKHNQLFQKQTERLTWKSRDSFCQERNKRKCHCKRNFLTPLVSTAQ